MDCPCTVGYGCIPIQFYLQKQVLVPLWPLGLCVPTPASLHLGRCVMGKCVIPVVFCSEEDYSWNPNTIFKKSRLGIMKALGWEKKKPAISHDSQQSGPAPQVAGHNGASYSTVIRLCSTLTLVVYYKSDAVLFSCILGLPDILFWCGLLLLGLVSVSANRMYRRVMAPAKCKEKNEPPYGPCFLFLNNHTNVFKLCDTSSKPASYSVEAMRDFFSPPCKCPRSRKIKLK